MRLTTTVLLVGCVLFARVAGAQESVNRPPPGGLFGMGFSAVPRHFVGLRALDKQQRMLFLEEEEKDWVFGVFPSVTFGSVSGTLTGGATYRGWVSTYASYSTWMGRSLGRT